MKISAKALLLRSTLLAALSVGPGLMSSAMAQDTVSSAQPASDEGRDVVVITGTRIASPNLVTTSPVTQVTSEDIQQTGVTRVEDLVTQLPQAFAAQNSTVSNGASGTATVSLRNLGSSRTLVLIDGRRMPYGSPTDDAADLNQIPGPLVERVEVLTGGASAVYGSDALAGVVNFIMKRDFEGLQIDTQYGMYQHENGYDDDNLRQVIAGRGATNPAQFKLPDDNVDDGISKEITAIFGVSSEDGRGNLTGYISYRNNESILQRDRDFSACSIGSATATGFTCGGSGTAFPGRFTDFATFNYTLDASNNFVPFVNARDQYNFGPLNYFQRPDERYAFGMFGRYDVNETTEAYADLMFSDYTSNSQIAPSGNFFGTSTINCGNPLLSAAQAAAIGCSPTEIAANTSTPLYIGRRNVEGGGRQDYLNYISYRGVAGVRGDLGNDWTYDVFAQYSKVSLSRVYQNDFSISRLNRAVNVVRNTAGTPVCASVLDGTDPNCVPYNPFTAGGITPAALNYLQIPLFQSGFTKQQVVSASAVGPIGFTFPTAKSPIDVAVGIEYRSDELTSETDSAFASGDGAGQGGPTIGLSGQSDVFDAFFEARIPIVEGLPLADQITMDLAYRRSEYENLGADTYKVGADWAPIADLRLRASFQQAVRAANVIELFAAQGAGLFDMDDDPCDATDPAADGVAAAAACVGTSPWQVTAGQASGGSLSSPAGQYQQLGGGNTLLNPEEAQTTTVGVVWQPAFLPSFNLSVDYFDIEIDGLVSSTGPLNTINSCYFFADATSCARISRSSNGSLWVGTGQVEDLNTNIGGLSTSGYDINANYSMDVDGLGGFEFSFVGTLLSDLITDPGLATAAPYDCMGFYGNQCGTPNPEWRHRARVGWETPWMDLNVGATWRHFGEVSLISAATNLAQPGRVDSVLEAHDYLDLSGSMPIGESINLRFGVNNVLDNDPPLSASVGTTGNGNTYPQSYDALGRFMFIGATVDF